MEYPKAGGIVIVDDKVNEALPLIQALSKIGLSSIYYDGNLKHFPKHHVECVRLIFMDMHFDNSIHPVNDDKTVISTLIGFLEKIINKSNGPYILFVWSKHESEHFKAFKEAIYSKFVDVHMKPIAVLSMQKSECFERRSETFDDEAAVTIQPGLEESFNNTEYVLKENGIELINKKLEEGLKEVDSFELFYNWENAQKSSSSNVINNICGFDSFLSKDWNTNIKSYIFKMAKANAGNNLSKNNYDIIKNMYFVLNELVQEQNRISAVKTLEKVKHINVLQDSTEDIVAKKNIDEKEYVIKIDEKDKYILLINGNEMCSAKTLIKLLNGIENDKKVVGDLINGLSNNTAQLNTKLLLHDIIDDSINPGNVYYIEDISLGNEMLSSFKIARENYDKVTVIEIEVSPSCDYAQKKQKRYRFLTGILYKANMTLDLKADYYQSSPSLLWENEVYNLAVDFRYFRTEKLCYLKGKNAVFGLNLLFLQSFKENFAKHAVRTGILKVE